MVWVTTEIQVELTDFETEDLIEELESRTGSRHVEENIKDEAERIWTKQRLGLPWQTDALNLILLLSGKVV